MTPRLLTKYTEEVRPHLNEQFQYKFLAWPRS